MCCGPFSFSISSLTLLSELLWRPGLRFLWLLACTALL